MPNPVTTYQTLKFLWNESRPVRDWLWSRLPSVRDGKKRETAEEHLAKLLDDANALAQALPAADLDAKIDERIERFRADLQAARIPKDEADLLTERATMFVRLMVTGPFADLVAIRKRLAELEVDFQESEKRFSAMEREHRETAALLQRTNTEVLQMRQHLFAAILVIAVLFVATILFAALR
ncbi:MAG TPA: hypothetical protein VGE01_11835 [Fimbriimonas sp.]